MHVSARTTYGLQALIDMAIYSDGSGGRLTTRDIATRQSIPERFLEQQITALKNAGLVHSHRGAAGGCSLARRPGEITVLAVLEALEGALMDDLAAGERNSETASGRSVAELWEKVGATLREVMEQVTIADLARREVELRDKASQMFYV